jgi:hypothetical protein
MEPRPETHRVRTFFKPTENIISGEKTFPMKHFHFRPTIVAPDGQSHVRRFFEGQSCFRPHVRGDILVELILLQKKLRRASPTHTQPTAQICGLRTGLAS